jgi:hypothetical protein
VYYPQLFAISSTGQVYPYYLPDQPQPLPNPDFLSSLCQAVCNGIVQDPKVPSVISHPVTQASSPISSSSQTSAEPLYGEANNKGTPFIPQPKPTLLVSSQKTSDSGRTQSTESFFHEISLLSNGPEESGLPNIPPAPNRSTETHIDEMSLTLRPLDNSVPEIPLTAPWSAENSVQKVLITPNEPIINNVHDPEMSLVTLRPLDNSVPEIPLTAPETPLTTNPIVDVTIKGPAESDLHEVPLKINQPAGISTSGLPVQNNPRPSTAASVEADTTMKDFTLTSSSMPDEISVTNSPNIQNKLTTEFFSMDRESTESNIVLTTLAQKFDEAKEPSDTIISSTSGMTMLSTFTESQIISTTDTVSQIFEQDTLSNNISESAVIISTEEAMISSSTNISIDSNSLMEETTLVPTGSRSAKPSTEESAVSMNFATTKESSPIPISLDQAVILSSTNIPPAADSVIDKINLISTVTNDGYAKPSTEESAVSIDFATTTESSPINISLEQAMIISLTNNPPPANSATEETILISTVINDERGKPSSTEPTISRGFTTTTESSKITGLMTDMTITESEVALAMSTVNTKLGIDEPTLDFHLNTGTPTPSPSTDETTRTAITESTVTTLLPTESTTPYVAPAPGYEGALCVFLVKGKPTFNKC